MDNLKAAFDRVDKEELWKVMEEREIRKDLINRTREICRSTKNAVKVYKKLTRFWTEKTVRQGCQLDSFLAVNIRH